MNYLIGDLQGCLEPLERLMAEIGEALDDAAVQSLLQAAHQHRLWSQALRLTAALSDTQRQRAGRLVLAAGPSMLEGLLRHIARHDEWPLLIDWHDALVPDTRRELLEAACRLGDALVAQWLAALSAQTLNLRLQDTLALCNPATHARVEAAIRRLPEAQQPELLALLAAEPQKVFSRDEILNRLRGQEAELFTRAVDILVSRLRRKLEPLDCIKTLRNAGYSLALRRASKP